MKTVLKWLKKEDHEENITIENNWLILKDSRIKLAAIESFQRYENNSGEFLIGVISHGRWYTIYKSESEKLRNKNFEVFEKFIFDNVG